MRHEILRPHQGLEQCRYEGDLDPSTLHYGLLFSGELIGMLSMYERGHRDACATGGWQLRAMAVREQFRMNGYGTLLLRAAESHVRARGASCIWANARKNALEFYQKSGYAIRGDEFMVEDIGSHYLIYKALSS